jgi:hypothetical protein
MTNRSVSLSNDEAHLLERLDTEDEGTTILRNFNTYLAYQSTLNNRSRRLEFYQSFIFFFFYFS